MRPGRRFASPPACRKIRPITAVCSRSARHLKIAIIGVGAIGGYVGARLAHAGEDVTFIARGAKTAIRSDTPIS